LLFSPSDMDRPPDLSLVFFGIAAGIVIWGAAATRSPTVQPYTEDESSYVPVETINPADPRPANAGAVAPDYGWTFNALDPSVLAAAETPSQFDPADDYWGLPRESGYELVAAYCVACHSLRIVMQQRASETRWRELMQWMVDKQGMADPPADDRETMIAYLSETYGQ
jgi:cytochrome c1